MNIDIPFPFGSRFKAFQGQISFYLFEIDRVSTINMLGSIKSIFPPPSMIGLTPTQEINNCKLIS